MSDHRLADAHRSMTGPVATLPSTAPGARVAVLAAARGIRRPGTRIPAAPGARIAVLAAALMLAASCGSGATGTVGQPIAGDGSEASEPVLVRLALPPDPVWQWLEDSGTVAQFESDRNIRVEASNPFDPFSAFAGGHADVVVVDALEVPQFAEQTGREPVIIGQAAFDRSILAVKRTSRAETLDDLVEATIAVDNSIGRLLLWGLIADANHDMIFRFGSPDFTLLQVESGSVADLVLKGDADACVCLPEFGVTHFANGTMRPLYGGRNASEIYAKDIIAQPLLRPMADAFVADREWLDRNRGATKALLDLWQVGLDAWADDKYQIIADYPHLFSVQGQAEVEWMASHANHRDWLSRSVYLTKDNLKLQDDMFARMHRLELISDDTVAPPLDLSFAADQ